MSATKREEVCSHLRYIRLELREMHQTLIKEDLLPDLNEAKESLLSTLDALSNIHSTDLIQIQIKEIYNKLEQMHDNRKKIESATNYLLPA